MSIPTMRLDEIRRYPVKSTRGQSLSSAQISDKGIVGDRKFALVDVQTNKVASAKHPKRWPNILELGSFYEVPDESVVRFLLPDGANILSTDPNAALTLSNYLGRPVRIVSTAFDGARAEGYWPDHDWLSDPDSVFEFPLPNGTFFDGALLHIIARSTLERLARLAPESRFDARRFRPNFIVGVDPAPDSFVENNWIGRELRIGAVRLRVDGPCPRCVMTTIAQADLPKDPDVLKTALKQNSGNVGVYASVLEGGIVNRGDRIELV